MRCERTIGECFIANGVLGLPCEHLLHPLGVVADVAIALLGFENLQEFDEHFAQVTDDRYIGLAVLADFCGIDIRVNDLGAGSEGRELPSDAIIKARTERDEEIAALHRTHCCNGAVHAGHAQVERMRIGHRTACHKSRD